MQRNGEDVYIVWSFFPDKIINDLQHLTYDRHQTETELALETVPSRWHHIPGEEVISTSYVTIGQERTTMS